MNFFSNFVFVHIWVHTFGLVSVYGSGVSVQVSAGKFRNYEFRNSGIEGILSF